MHIDVMISRCALFSLRRLLLIAWLPLVAMEARSQSFRVTDTDMLANLRGPVKSIRIDEHRVRPGWDTMGAGHIEFDPYGNVTLLASFDVTTYDYEYDDAGRLLRQYRVPDSMSVMNRKRTERMTATSFLRDHTGAVVEAITVRAADNEFVKREVFRRDSLGRIVERVVRRDDGNPVSRRSYRYGRDTIVEDIMRIDTNNAKPDMTVLRKLYDARTGSLRMTIVYDAETGERTTSGRFTLDSLGNPILYIFDRSYYNKASDTTGYELEYDSYGNWVVLRAYNDIKSTCSHCPVYRTGSYMLKRVLLRTIRYYDEEEVPPERGRDEVWPGVYGFPRLE